MAHKARTGTSSTWRVFALIALAVGAACLVPLAVLPDRIEAVRMVIRLTARISLALFLLAFLASTFVRLWPGEASRWVLAHRRAMGLGFAWSHLIHAGALVILYRTDAALFWTLTNPVSITGGSVAYAFIAMLAATSFDGAVRAMGPQRWQQLHRTGLAIVWLVFLISNAKRVPTSAGYLVPSLILIAALALRVYAAWHKRGAPVTT